MKRICFNGGGVLLLTVFRSIFITETASNWIGMTYFASILGIMLCMIILITFPKTAKFLDSL